MEKTVIVNLTWSWKLILSQARAGLLIKPRVCRSPVYLYKNKPEHAQTKVSTKVDEAQQGKELPPT
jgi:hypothetical protein